MTNLGHPALIGHRDGRAGTHRRHHGSPPGLTTVTTTTGRCPIRSSISTRLTGCSITTLPVWDILIDDLPGGGLAGLDLLSTPHHFTPITVLLALCGCRRR